MIHTENKALSYSKMNKLTGQIKPKLKFSHRLNANTFILFYYYILLKKDFCIQISAKVAAMLFFFSQHVLGFTYIDTFLYLL